MEDNSLTISVNLVDEASAGLAELSDEVSVAAEDIAASGDAMAASLAESTSEMDASLAEFGLTMNETTGEITNALLTQQQSFDLAAEAFAVDGEEMQQTMIDNGITAQEAAAVIDEANAEIEASSAESTAVSKTGYLQLAVVAGLAFGAVMAGVNNATSAAKDWSETSAVINQELKDTGASLPLTQIQAYASSLSQTTLFTQQAILDSESLIMAHIGLQGSYQQVTSLSEDLATKMKTDLPNATKILTNALTNPVQGFSQLIRQGGIDLPASQVAAIQSMAKMGDTAGAAALIIKSLNGSIGGAAAAAAQAPGAGMTLLSQNLNAMGESIGTALIPALDKLAEDISPVVIAIGKWAEANPVLTEAIVGFVVVLTGLVLLLGVLGALVFTVDIALAALAAPFALIGVVGGGAIALLIAGVALLVTAIILIWTHWNEIWGWIKTEISDLGQDFQVMGANWSAAMTSFGNVFSGVWNGIKTGFEAVINDMIGFVEGYVNAWINGVNFIIKALDSIQVSIPKWVPGIGGSSFGLNIPQVPTISLPRLEFGGTVPGMTGEEVPIIAHGGETVIPAEASNGGGQTVVIQVINPNVRSQADIQNIRNVIDQYMRPLLRNSKIIHV